MSTRTHDLETGDSPQFPPLLKKRALTHRALLDKLGVELGVQKVNYLKIDQIKQNLFDREIDLVFLSKAIRLVRDNAQAGCRQWRSVFIQNIFFGRRCGEESVQRT